MFRCMALFVNPTRLRYRPISYHASFLLILLSPVVHKNMFTCMLNRYIDEC